MRPATCFAACILLATQVVQAQVTVRKDAVTQPGTIQRPDAQRISGRETERFRLLRGQTPEQHFPEAARKEGLDGIVVVDLLLNDQGQVLEAQVVAESPAGKGFGLAALDVAKTFEFANPLKKLVLISVNVEFLP